VNHDAFNTFPDLETTRLTLRTFNLQDSALVYEFNTNPDTLKYVPRDPYPDLITASDRVADFLKSFQEKKAVWWVFVIKESAMVAGYGGLFNIDWENSQAEIGYGLLKPFWGSGIAGECLAPILQYGLNEINIHRVYGNIQPGNLASRKLVERKGFKLEGRLIDNVFARGQYFDTMIYSLINPLHPSG